MTPLAALKQYWGHSSFRPLQESIISAILNGEDTLALLPTGGGKSVCYQVPAVILKGVTIVISPLIALIKDQVEELKSKGIRAEAIYSGMKHRDIDRILDNVLYGNIKLLYCSPERLLTELAAERIKNMDVSLIAVDEAHCISKWGYDFRPAYLQISNLRTWHPQAPIIALTATATTVVATDIQEKLSFKSDHCIRSSFGRENISLEVIHCESKMAALPRMFSSKQDSHIVYVYSRKDAQRYAQLLQRHGLSADYYHAGLSSEERMRKQDEWKAGHTKIIVSTNAFGMGIDKSDVRQVIHTHIPSSIEAYYQEAGRAGRDQLPARAVLLFENGDQEKVIQRAARAFPEISFIKDVYHSIGSYLSIAVGSHVEESLAFDLLNFAEKFNYNLMDCYHAIRVLERYGFIKLLEQSWKSSEIKINISSSQTRSLINNRKLHGLLINGLLRLYQGIGTDFIFINEGKIARYINQSTAWVKGQLQVLQTEGILDYRPRSEQPQIIFLTPRFAKSNLHFDFRQYRERKQSELQSAQKMVAYTETPKCRQNFILNYFNEKTPNICTKCDICRQTESQHQGNLASKKSNYLMDEHNQYKKGKEYL